MHVEWQKEVVLGALRFVDEVTGRPLTAGVMLEAPGLRLLHKPNGDHVILAADGLVPATGGDFPIDACPASGAYSPRRSTLHLPRDADPANAALGDSLFQPALISMLPAGAYPTGANLALLRVTLRRTTDNARIGNALIRLRTTPPLVPNGRSLTDAAGEALVVVPGVPLANAGPGATVVSDIAAQVEVLVDPATATFTADADIDAARAKAALATTNFPDPDDIELRLGPSAPPATPVRIGAGLTAFAKITWAPP